MLKRNRLLFILLVLIFTLSACGSKTSAFVLQGVGDTAKTMASNVNAKDIEGFLKLIDDENKEFYAEEKHWFEDVMYLDIKDYNIQIEDASMIDSNVYKVNFNQAGQLDGSKFFIKSTGIFKLVDGVYKFSDLDFDTAITEHFIIKYTPSLKKQAEAFSSFVDEAYKQVEGVYGDIPKDRTVIKLYDNGQIFNWYIKPSISFAMGGWYEYPESIKINMSSMRNFEKSKLQSRFVDVISHELTHRTNMMESNNNIPYWMAEGIATYVQNGGIINTAQPEMSIIKLEKVNLEKLNKADEISAYYNSAYINISKFVKKYGMEKLHGLLAELKKYPLQQKTGGQSIDESNRKLHETLSRYMSMSFEQLDKELSAAN